MADDIFYVEKILDKEVKENGEIRYLIKWVDFPDTENSWETLENVSKSAQGAVDDYEARVAAAGAGEQTEGRSSLRVSFKRTSGSRSYSVKVEDIEEPQSGPSKRVRETDSTPNPIPMATSTPTAHPPLKIVIKKSDITPPAKGEDDRGNGGGGAEPMDCMDTDISDSDDGNSEQPEPEAGARACAKDKVGKVVAGPSTCVKWNQRRFEEQKALASTQVLNGPPVNPIWNFGHKVVRGEEEEDPFAGIHSYQGAELLCQLPKGRTPFEVTTVLPPTWFGALAYAVSFKDDITGEITGEAVHHHAFKFKYPQLLIECYQKNSAFYTDPRTEEELAILAYAALGAAREQGRLEDSDDDSDSDDEEEHRQKVPLIEDTTSESETESESDIFEKIDIDAMFYGRGL